MMCIITRNRVYSPPTHCVYSSLRWVYTSKTNSIHIDTTGILSEYTHHLTVEYIRVLGVLHETVDREAARLESGEQLGRARVPHLQYVDRPSVLLPRRRPPTLTRAFLLDSEHSNGLIGSTCATGSIGSNAKLSDVYNLPCTDRMRSAYRGVEYGSTYSLWMCSCVSFG